MEVKINKEIGDYNEQLFFGFSPRQTLTAIIIVFTSIAIAIITGNIDLDNSVTALLIIIICGPIAFLGFYSYNGLSAWQLILALVRSTILMPPYLTYQSENIYYDLFRSYKKEVRPKVKRDKALRKARSLHPVDETVTIDESDIRINEPVPATIDALMDEMTEEEKEKEKERILKKEIRKKKAIKSIKRFGSLLVDIIIWVIISLVITYIVNKTDILSIIGEWLQKLFH